MLINMDNTHTAQDIGLRSTQGSPVNSPLLPYGLDQVINIPENILTQAHARPETNHSVSDNFVAIDIPSCNFRDSIMIEMPEFSKNNISGALEKNNQCGDRDDTDIPHNTMMSVSKRYTKNVGVSLVRSAVSVGPTTALREYFRRVVLPNILHTLPHFIMPTLSAVMIALPIALQLIGATRDYLRGEITLSVLAARISGIAILAGTGGYLYQQGKITEATSSLIAAVVFYTLPRDAIQFFFNITDNNQVPIAFRPTVYAAGAYAVNQFFVDQGMDHLAEALTPLLGVTLANVLGKAMVNVIGETCDELTYRGLHANAEKNENFSMKLEMRPWSKVTLRAFNDHFFNTLTSRATTLVSAFSAAIAVPLSGMANSAVVGGAMSFAYPSFVYAHAQQREEKGKRGNNTTPETEL